MGDLKALPEALTKRHTDVTLSDGSVIRVLKWSWPKFQKLIILASIPAHSLEVAVESVAEGDREKVDAMDPDDIMTLARAAVALNVTETTRKNLVAQLQQRGEIEAALGIQTPPTPEAAISAPPSKAT